jgi:hypothetical protein
MYQIACNPSLKREHCARMRARENDTTMAGTRLIFQADGEKSGIYYQVAVKAFCDSC